MLVALIGMLLMLAAPAVASAQGAARGAQADSRLIAAGSGYGSPQGSQRVRDIQHRLIRAGERPGPVDGLYGPLTKAAVERFQAGEGLAVDGIVGPHTASALNRQRVLISDGAGYSKPSGSTRVRGLQHRLRRAGERPGTLDGRYGPRTESAVERFQTSHGLAVDGIVGPATSEQLARFAATSGQAPKARPEQADKPSAKPRPAPSPSPAPDSTVQPAPHRTVEQTPRQPVSTPDRDDHGSGIPVWVVAVAFATALLLGGALVLVFARRTKKEEPDPEVTEPRQRSFQVRFHGRDGQGVMTAAELLSVAALVEGRDALAFPSFRSGPAGPRVVAFCRIGGSPIRPRESIGKPDGLIVQDPEAPQLADLCDGLKPDGYLLVNSARTIEELGLDEVVTALRPDRRLSMPASEIAREYLGLPIADAALVGGFAALSGCVSLESVASSIRERFPGQTGDGDVAAAEAGFHYVESEVRGLARIHGPGLPASVGRASGVRGAA
jgi:pyruvate ferredoxin oxidoreductase gamma subunit